MTDLPKFGRAIPDPNSDIFYIGTKPYPMFLITSAIGAAIELTTRTNGMYTKDSPMGLAVVAATEFLQMVFTQLTPQDTERTV